jgi:PH (Pleckstrin Homology) domain-containing protein
VTTRVVLRPELPQRIFWGVDIVVFGPPVIAIPLDPMPFDGASLFFLVLCAAMTAAATRSLFIRAVANEYDVRVVGLLSDRTYPWDSIARIDGLPESQFVVLVTDSGKRHRIPGLRQSLAEQIQDRPSHTKHGSERLQQLLQNAERGALTSGAKDR